MNDHDFSRHLNDYAVGIESNPDTEGIRRGMRRIDRNRRIRTVGAAGSMVAIVAFGFMALGGSGQPTTELDVRGEIPSPVPADPEVIPGLVEQPDSDASSERGPENDAGDVSAPPPDPDPPIHLLVSPTTTAAPAVASTVPPTTVPATTAPPTTVPATTAPPTTTVAAASFSAGSRYGSCEEDPPYDEYSGTASPGTTIMITSPYSAPAQTVADASGQWYLRVEFPTAPVNSPFSVSASDGTTSVDLSFVHVG